MRITRPPSTDPIVVELCDEQQAELAERERGVVDDALKPPLDPRISFLVLWQGDQAVGCAGLQPMEPGAGEVKRMYVRPAWRGRGLSRRLLAEVESLAAEAGVTVLRLETGRLFAEAVGLYTSSGFQQIPRFGEYVDSSQSVCFEKRIGSTANARVPRITGHERHSA
ncbi:GNAT family N-acetyltransferase [Nonomuraea sp. NN258]|uniref:GNAT family N-acetyltransferase n=1 Tax=Nonomuraea antri TaxID=2730852 RepID=UPI00156903A8|nr:GNAT family N-acetyltransferase [Nonomuraea antri]NRQ37970.1 GNAT family N-acetyltransferase [Nonomuraea antri]